ncbi:TetR/AcrR family transcriptional regulator [Kordiimonas sp. SCSIO 12603]|uniref:TetR/AcrR family transcriptional regulator n=1 Tax=Kordiimonas sp. SCSIO 12603 TaxID=2829596 RepID=UPI002107BA77|nr:TetR/AcrR family transcriptional regulator [Kordiimonas sp. SCSIO 12603]UTW58260.1 TetR/AcrR family transcriptional regulator [Kordiimonas sp. SCSIO 12603]
MTNQSDGKTRRADATRTALIEAAERLIAQNGLADVSTREILQEAGQRNQSALQYHFGSKEGLISATINERTGQMDKRRQEMIEKLGDDPSMREILEVMVLPLCELIENDAAGKNYLIFLAQAITQPSWDLRAIIKEYDIKGLDLAYQFYDKKLAHLSNEERKLRQAVGYDLTILSLTRWCLSDDENKRSLEDMIEFVINSTIAVVEG